MPTTININRSNNSANNLGILSSDPTSPNEGDTWYNSTDKKWKGYFNGAIKEIDDTPESDPWTQTTW